MNWDAFLNFPYKFCYISTENIPRARRMCLKSENHQNIHRASCIIANQNIQLLFVLDLKSFEPNRGTLVLEIVERKRKCLSTHQFSSTIKLPAIPVMLIGKICHMKKYTTTWFSIAWNHDHPWNRTRSNWKLLIHKSDFVGRVRRHCYILPIIQKEIYQHSPVKS